MSKQSGVPIWGEYYAYSTVFTLLQPGNGTVYSDGEIRIDSDADFSFVKTIYTSTNDNADIKVRYRDDSTGRYLMKNASQLRLIAGQALPIDNLALDFRPFIWPSPYLIRRATTFMIQMSNTHPVITPTIYLTFHGAKLWPGKAPWKDTGMKMPYVYNLTRNNNLLPEAQVQIPANGSATAVISVDKDSDFLVQKITGDAQGPALITIQEQGRDRQWSNGAMHINNLIGGGWSPNILPAPRFLAAGTTITINYQDLSGATNIQELNLIGTKIFNRR